MTDDSIQNKKAWEYNAYDFWVKETGLPADRAKKIASDPIGGLKRYGKLNYQNCNNLMLKSKWL